MVSRSTPGKVLACITAAVLVAGAAACTPSDPDDPTPTPSVTGAAPTDPVPTTPGSEPTAPTSPEVVAGALPVYYALDDAGRLRLVREFHKLESGDSTAAKTRAAINEMLKDSAYDPDYKTLWPSGAKAMGVHVAGDTVTVDLSGARTNNVGSEAAAQAVQQLIWTATAASGKPKVVIELDGSPVDELWGHVSTAGPQTRAPAADIVNQVWLISPQHGDTVGKTVTVHVAGIVFEATMNWEVRKGTTVVKKGFVTLNAGAPAQGELKFTIDLEPGTYVLEAFEVSAKDGSKQHQDNHTITVK